MTKFLGKGEGAEARRNVSCRSAGEKRRASSLEVEELEEEPENYKWRQQYSEFRVKEGEEKDFGQVLMYLGMTM